MGELIKIKDVSAKYLISARTLRYYEDMGLIISKRSDDYSYRLYDEATMQRLEQILILRKLNISIKDIQRIFSTSGSEVVLEVLSKKVDAIDEEVSLLHELKKIVLDFIKHIEQTDFAKDSDVKLLYEKAKEIETTIVNVDYNGNPSSVNRLIEVTEKLDKKIPDIIVTRIPNFKAMTTGLVGWDEVFNMGIDKDVKYQELITPIIFDGHDFLYGKGDKVAWIWRVKDGVTEADTQPFEIIEHPGGLYAVAVSVDGDGESHEKVRSKVQKWLESTNFVIDNDREMMGHMIYVDDEIKKGLGYEQMALYAPIKLSDNESVTQIDISYPKKYKKMMHVIPNLHFNGDCIQAIELYKKAFDAETKIILQYADANPEDFIMNDESKKNWIYHSEIVIGNDRLMLSDTREDDLQNNKSLSLLVHFDTSEEIMAAYELLSDGAVIISPMASQTYCAHFASLIDKYGMGWDLMAG